MKASTRVNFGGGGAMKNIKFHVHAFMQVCGLVGCRPGSTAMSFQTLSQKGHLMGASVWAHWGFTKAHWGCTGKCREALGPHWGHWVHWPWPQALAVTGAQLGPHWAALGLHWGCTGGTKGTGDD